MVAPEGETNVAVPGGLMIVTGHSMVKSSTSKPMFGSKPAPKSRTTLTIPLPETFHVQLPGWPGVADMASPLNGLTKMQTTKPLL